MQNRSTLFLRRFKVMMAILFVAVVAGNKSYASINVTTASGGTNICTNKASDGSAPAYTTLGNITVTEGSSSDMGGGTSGSWSTTLTFTAPSGWQFNTSVAPTYTFTSSRNISSVTGSFSSGNLVVTINGSGNGSTDAFSIIGLQVAATTSASNGSFSASGNIYVSSRSGSSMSGLSTGSSGTPFGTLSQSPAAITGSALVCMPSTVALSDATSGGTWTSSNTAAATVSSSGVVTGVTDGTTNITYTSSGCVTWRTLTVNSTSPSISNNIPLCTSGSSNTLVGTPSGGTWASSNTSTATITSSTGSMSPVASGTTTISYTATSGCLATVIGTVNSRPSQYNVTGGGSYCSGGTGVTIGQDDSQTGINYQLFNGSTAVGSAVAGTSSAISFGLQTGAGTYTVLATNTSTGCTRTMSGSATITVNTTPTISNNIPLCTSGSSNTLTASPSGGTWSSSNTSVATISSSSGSMTPSSSSSGTTTISYTATNGCTTSAIGTVNARPSSNSATGGGSYCSGGTGVNVGLGSSQTGINYQLYVGASAVGSPVAGTGSAISFGPQTAAGTYTVNATNATTGCSRAMTGSATVTINANPTLFSVTGGGSYCSGGSGLAVGLNGSQTGVNYQLYNGASTSGSAVSGTGATLNFGLKTAAGTYTVLATNSSTSCTSSMTSSAVININASATVYSVTGGGTDCAGTGVDVGLSNSETGVDYQLYNGGSAVGSSVGGTGSALDFGFQMISGTYTVLATNTSTACTKVMTGSAAVTIGTNPTAFSVTGGGSYCFGGSGLAVSLSGSQSGVNYQLYNGSSPSGTVVAGTGSALNFGLKTAAGIYTVRATNASNSCASDMTDSAVIIVNPLPTAFTVTGGGTDCAAAGVAVGLSNSESGIDYQLYNGGTAVGTAISGTGAALDFGLQTTSGSYTILATNTSTTCTVNMTGSAAVTISTPPSVFSVTGGGSYCSGGSGLTVGLSGSQSGVNYQLYNGSSTSGTAVAGTGSTLDFGSKTTAGTYTVRATNASNSCASDMTDSAVIIVNPLPTAFTVSGGGTDCTGAGVAVGLTNSETGIDYQLYNGSTAAGSAISGTGAALDFGMQMTSGTYAVRATNTSTTCTANMTGSAVVTIGSGPTAFSVTGGGTYCAGGSGLAVGLSGSESGVNYQLYNGSTASGSAIAGTGSILNFGLKTAAGTYTVRATNAISSCASNMTDSAVIIVNANATVYNVTGGGTDCSGTGVAVGLSNSEAGVDYQLYNGATAVGTAISGTGAALDFGFQMTTGTYTVLATNTSTSCTKNMSGSAAVTIGTAPSVFSITGGGSYCSGGTGLSVGLSGSQTGVNYQLYNGSTASGTAVAGTGSTLDFGLETAVGTYTVRATSGDGICSSNMTSSAVIVVNSLPTTFTVTGGGTACSASSGVTVGLSGSQTGINYQLYNGATTAGSPIAGTSSSLSFGSQTSSGTYTVLATNASTACTRTMTGSAAVTINTTPTISNNIPLCSSGSSNTLIGTPSGGTWSSSNTLVASISSSTGSMSPSFSTGTTTISYTATNGCVATAIGTVNARPSSNTVGGGGTYCSGGSGVSVTLGGSQTGTNYQLYNGATTVGSPVAGTGSALDFGLQTAAGTYTVLAANPTTGCSRSMSGSATVTINSAPTVFSVTGGGSYCSGGTGISVGLSGSQTGVNYQLYNGSTTSGSAVAGTGSALSFGLKTAAGSYTVRATNTSTSCASDMTSSAVIVVNATATAYSVTGGGTDCAGTGVAVGLTNSESGVDYQLYNGSSAVGTPISGTGAGLDFGFQMTSGTYTVLASNTSTGCTKNMTGSAAVTIGTNPTVFSVTGGGAYCSGGSGLAVGMSGSQTGVNYQLYNGAATSGTAIAGTGSALNFGLKTAAGSYTVRATNASNSCNSNMTDSAVIIVNASATPYAVTGGGTDCSGPGIAVGLANSETGVDYQLYNGSTPVGTTMSGTGSSLDFGLQTTSGTYTILATNTTTTCTRNMTGSATVSIGTTPTVFTVTGGGTYCSGGTGFSVGLTGSEPGVNYQLYNGSTTSGTAIAGTGSALDFGVKTAAGTYTVRATSASSTCASNMTSSAVIVVNSLPTTFSLTGGGTGCSAGSGVNVGLSGSQTGISYQLYNGASVTGSPVTGTGSSISFGGQTVGGTYTVLATNSSTSCTRNMTGSSTVTINTSAAISNNIPLCNSGSSNTLTASPSGGTWSSSNTSVATISSSSGTMTPSSSTSGTTTISYTATNGCVSTVIGTVNARPSSNTVSGGGTYCPGTTGVNVTLGGSQTGVNYQLYVGSTATGSPVAGTGSSISFGPQTTAGTYTVQATNATTACVRSMSGSVTVTSGTNPSTFTVTGGGAFCDGASGAAVGLSGSQTGVNYQLYNGAAISGTAVAGTGAALNFGLKTASGTYTVRATNTSTSCNSDMTGSAIVNAVFWPSAFAMTGGGAYCAGGPGVPVGVASSETGVNYQLYRGATAVGSVVAGTGAALDMGLQASAGTYSVRATTALASCTGVMMGTSVVSINSNPTAFPVTGGGAYCTGSAGVSVGLGGSQTGVNYQLYNGSSTVGSPVAGTGSALNFGLQTSTGTYSVNAVNASTSCAADMTSTATVSINTTPTAYSVTGGGSYCASGAGVSVGLGGSQTGINYQLYNGSATVGSPVAGTGSALHFGLQTAAGTYSVVASDATTSCAANMTSTATVSINSAPTAYAVTGGGAYCTGGAGVSVGLGNSQTGVNYQLYNGSSAVGSPVAGTGSALDFGLITTAGTYSVNAVYTGTSCTADMTSTATVSINTNPAAYTVTGGGAYCTGGSGVSVGLGGSEAGVNYQLYNGSSTVGSPVGGTGSTLDFGLQTAAGSYSVHASNATTSCAADMTSTATISINTNPTAYAVTGGGAYCAGGTGVSVGLGGSETGANYQLYNGSTAVGSAVAGTGSVLDFGLQTTAGTYSVNAVYTGTSCAADMTSTATVSINTNPTAYAVTGGGAYCAGGTGVSVALGGSQTGVNYQLYNGATAVGSPIAGTGSALDFGLLTTAGTYSVVASNATTSCATDMTDDATVSINSNPTPYTVIGGGAYCAGGTGAGVGLGGSETGVNYQLYNGSTTVGSLVAGTGSSLNFGLQTSAGTYHVYATNATTSCASDMSSMVTVSINNNPTAYAVTGGGAYCSGGAGVTVGLGGSDTGVNYQLYNGSTAISSAIAGNGSALDFGLQTTAGTYSVVASDATTSCATDMTSAATVSINANPTAYAVTGGGAYCTGGTGVSVGLGGSQTGINYQLYNGPSTVGSSVAGTGSALDFGLQTAAGTYSVHASNTSTSCAADMTSSATVSINNNPTAYAVTGGGAYCAGGTGVSVGLGGSETGANYQLYNGSTAVGSAVAGTGSVLDFGLQTTAGTYSVNAVYTGTSCAADMTSTATVSINTNPTAYTVTGGGAYCAGGTGVTVGLGNSQTGVNYQLYNGASTVGSPVAGTGSALDFGLQTLAGTYSVVASNATTSCATDMTSAAMVSINANPTAYAVTGGGAYCSGGTGVSVGLGGSETGVNYQLYNGSTAVGSPVAGTGSALNFGLQTTAGTYSVGASNATTACVADMTSTATVSINTNPTAYAVTGGGAYCAGGAGVTVGLGGSQTGVNYQLYNGSATVGSPVAGTGSALDFGLQTAAGTYSVVASDATTSCATDMTSAATVSINANPTTYAMTGGGAYCTGGSGVSVGLGGSQTGVNYQLYEDSTAVGSPVAGTGSALDFGLQTAAGTYSVHASNATTSCAADMTSSATVSINNNPTAYAVTGGGAYCAGGTGVSVGLGGSETGANYQLYNGSTAVGSAVAGTGSVLDFGLQTTAGTYSVNAVYTGTSCTADMTSTATVSINTNPTPYTVTGGGAYCAGGTGVTIGLGGSQTGVNYQLYNGASAVGSPVAGTGSTLNFGLQTLVGTYSVVASDATTSCATDMTSAATVSINANPTAYAVTGGGAYCSGGTGVSVGLGGSETGVNYQLYNGSTTVGSPVAGTGSALDFGLQTAAGTYSVHASNASTSCAADMTSSVTVNVNTNPTAYAVTGGGAYCAGGTGVTVGLGGSQTGVNYQLYNGSATVGSPVAGTGSALDFGLQTAAGTYSVVASDATTSCTTDMTSAATVSINANPTAYSVSGGGAYCTGGSGVAVGLGGSETGVNYQLYNGSSIVGSPVAGTGSVLNFGLQTAAGTYSVHASNATTSCAADMTSSATVSINNNPTAYAVTGGGAYCAGGTGVTVGLGGSEIGANYQLYNGASTVGSPISGTGAALDFGLQTAAGTYSVNAVYTGTSCAADMTSTATVSINTNPTAYAVTGGGAYCAGGTGVTVGLGGSQTGVNYQLYNGASTVGSPVAGTGSTLNFGLQTLVGTYSVVASDATTSCATDMTSAATVSINANPTAYAVTGGGAYCSGGTGVSVGLSGSETGVNYQLYNGSTTVGSPVAGTGSALDFGLQTAAGTYSVHASNTSTSCAADMTSTATVSINPLPDAGSITGAATVCASGTTTLGSTVSGGFWSTGSTGTATVDAGGVVTGVAAGIAMMSYTVINGCGTDVATQIVTVNPLPDAGSITGTPTVCASSTITLGSTVSGGSWSTGAAGIATINSGGVVTGVAAGTAMISYTVINGCGTVVATQNVTVNPLPDAGTIVGATSVTAGSTITLSNSTIGGTWSSGTPAIATISSTGVVSGASPGTAMISYSVTNSCGTAVTTQIETVDPLIDPIVGAAAACVGSTTTLTPSVSGGTWGSSNTSIATVSGAGVVTGMAAGMCNITYTVFGSPNTRTVTINALPDAGVVTGASTVMAGSSITMSSAVGGGHWHCGTPSIATVNSAGVVSGVSAGSATISYDVSNSCGADTTTKAVTVNSSGITGSLTVCTGGTTTLTPSVSGGTWSSSNTARAIVSSVGVVTGITAGTVTISYVKSGGITTVVVTVNAYPPAISGSGTVCAGSTASMSNTVTGGTWSSTNMAVGTINTSGVLSGLTQGTTTIVYTLITGCRSSRVVTVNAIPMIGGTMAACPGVSTGLTSTPAAASWSSSNTSVATISASGMVSAVSTGTTIISVVTSAGCTVGAVFSVTAPPPAITGTQSVCLGSTTTLSNSTTGGTWSSSNSRASISTSGVVTGNSSGTSIISYRVGAGCVRTAVVTVNSLPSINGTATMCVGTSASLSGTPSIGTWSTAGGVATVSGTGIVTGLTPGTTNITYKASGTGCSSSVVATVSPTPGSITGTTSVCVNATTSLSNTVGGGSWSSSNNSVASVGASTGVITGGSAGTTTITYRIGTCRATTPVTVMALPNAITGTTRACPGTATTLSCTPSGGAWSGGTPTIATINAAGIVSGIAAGTTAVTYTGMNTCKRTTVVTVNPIPTITGALSVCLGSNTNLSGSGSGSWSSSDITKATVNNSGVVRGIGLGTSRISYTSNTGCAATAVVTVNPVPSAITGTTSVCSGRTTTLGNSVSGGTWSSVSTVLSVTGSGIVTGLTAGTGIVTYSLASGCRATTFVTVKQSPDPISGPSTICTGTTGTLTETVSGIWSSTNTAVATIPISRGSVFGASAGTSTIVFTASNGCTTTKVVNVTNCAAKGTGTMSDINLSLYPNPTGGTFTVKTSEAGTLSVYSLEGKEVLHTEVKAGATEVSLPSDMANGMYICHFTGNNNGETLTIRLIYEKN